jgi:hypothetical protein
VKLSGATITFPIVEIVRFNEDAVACCNGLTPAVVSVSRPAAAAVAATEATVYTSATAGVDSYRCFRRAEPRPTTRHVFDEPVSSRLQSIGDVSSRVEYLI